MDSRMAEAFSLLVDTSFAIHGRDWSGTQEGKVSERRFERRKLKRSQVDTRHEQTVPRVAFQE
jgi:hypothetical protein